MGSLFRRAERAVAMMTVAETLARAMQAHKAGRWQQAEALYRQVLQPTRLTPTPCIAWGC